MKATIWHNPACGTSRKTLAILEEVPGIALSIVRYLDMPYDRATLSALIADAGLTPREAMRLRGTDAEARGLGDADADTILTAMIANPAYVERPFVRTDKGAALCRPQDKVRDLL
jgi:arsenate reductase (glutaredoxin)